MDYRTDLAMERTVRPGGMGAGVSVHTQQQAGAEVTWVRVSSEKAAERLGKAQGLYWTLTHPKLPHMLPEERMDIAREVAQMLRMMLPPQGDVLVLGLGNRRMTADALGDRVVSGILVTRHMQEERLRSVCAVAPGVLGITGVETAELALGLAERVKPSAVIVVDALAAMETNHIATTIQLTDTGIAVWMYGQQDKPEPTSRHAWDSFYCAYRTDNAVYLYVEKEKAYLLNDRMEVVWKFLAGILPKEKLHDCRKG